MANCTQCGLPIPDRQRVCSMCYGDPNYGSDGHYRRWLEEQERQRIEREQQEREEEQRDPKGVGEG